MRRSAATIVFGLLLFGGCLSENFKNPTDVSTPSGALFVLIFGSPGAGTESCTPTNLGGAMQGCPLSSTVTFQTYATGADFNEPHGITTDGTNLYVADTYNHRIRQVVIASGAVTTLAGSGAPGNTDAIGTGATFFRPQGITYYNGILYVADTNNSLIRRIVVSTGLVSTFAGSGAVGSDDGTGTAASFGAPRGITTDGTNLYVADTNHLIRKIVISTAVVSTFAGSGVLGSADGIGAAASFQAPRGIATDGTYLYVADTDNYLIRRIEISTQVVSTLAGSGSVGSNDGTGAGASFASPYGIMTDGQNVYVADTANQLTRRIVPDTGLVQTVSGGSGLSTAQTTDGRKLYQTTITSL